MELGNLLDLLTTEHKESACLYHASTVVTDVWFVAVMWVLGL